MGRQVERADVPDGIAGGQENLVQDNDVRGSTRYGIAVFVAINVLSDLLYRLLDPRAR